MLQENNPDDDLVVHCPCPACEFICQTFIDAAQHCLDQDAVESPQLLANMVRATADTAAVICEPGHEDSVIEALTRLFAARFRSSVIKHAQFEAEQGGVGHA